MSHQSATFTDGVVVTTGTTTPSGAFPPKPQHWAILPGKLLLSGIGTAGSDSNRPTTGRVVTQLEIIMSEQWAWEDVLTDLGGTFDVCDWGEKPPYGLERIWSLLASAYLMQMAYDGQTVDGRISPIWSAYIDMARSELDRIKSGAKVLSDAACKPIYPAPSRVGTLKIGVAGPTSTIFAAKDDEALDLNYIGGSLQEIQRLHGRASVTRGGTFPVSA